MALSPWIVCASSLKLSIDADRGNNLIMSLVYFKSKKKKKKLVLGGANGCRRGSRLWFQLKLNKKQLIKMI